MGPGGRNNTVSSPSFPRGVARAAADNAGRDLGVAEPCALIRGRGRIHNKGAHRLIIGYLLLFTLSTFHNVQLCLHDFESKFDNKLGMVASVTTVSVTVPSVQ